MVPAMSAQAAAVDDDVVVCGQADLSEDEESAERNASELGRIRKNLAALAAGQLFTWTMTLAWTLVVPRLLGPRGMGMVTTGTAVAGIVQILLGTGTGTYVARELVVSPGRAPRLVATAMIARVVLAPVFMATIVVWSLLAHYGSEGNLVLYLMGGATVMTLLAEPLQSYFQATERMQYRALSDSITKGSLGLVGIVLAVVGFGALGFAACSMVTAGVVVLLSLKWTRRYLRLDLHTSWQDLRDLARGSLVYWTGGVFFLIYLWIDTAMLSVMTNPTVVGWYGVPSRFFQTLFFVPTLFATAWLPRLVRAAERSRSELHEAARTPVALVLSLALPLGTAMAVSASALIHIVYGPAYSHAVPVLMILGIGLVPTYLNMLLGQICFASKLTGRFNWLMVGATVVNPALNAVLIPLTQHHLHNGAIGAAIALGATEALIMCGGIAIVGRHILGRFTLVRLARSGLASAGMLVVVELTRSAGPVLSVVAGGVALLVLSWVCAITRQERRQLLAMMRRVAGNLKTRLTRRTRAARAPIA